MATADASNESLATSCPEKDSTPYERIVLEPPPNLEKEIEEAKGTQILFIFLYFIQHCFIYRPSDFTASEDAGIEPRYLQLRLWLWLSDALTARLDLIHSTARSHPQFG